MAHKRKAQRPSTLLRRLLRAEQLEDRRLLAVTGSILEPDNQVLFEGDGANDLVQFSVVDGYLQHNLGSRPEFASNRDLDSATPGEQALMMSEIGGFRYEDAGKNDRFFFTGGTAISFGESDAQVSAGEITVNAGTPVDSAGGRIVLNAATELLLNAGSSLTTVDGGISLTANPDGISAGEFIGLEVQGATIATRGTGNIELVGFGGDDTSEIALHGVVIREGTIIESTSQLAGAGTISIHGSAGDSSSRSSGVVVDGADIVISSAYGNIDIVGQGQQRSTAGTSQIGVQIVALDTIASTGGGPDAATITIDGTGGLGHRFTYGVSIRGASTDITSVDGNILIVGQGGGIGFRDFNQGVHIDGIGAIQSTGDTAAAAMITIIGDGGNGSANDIGVSLAGADTRVSSGYGDIAITGRGGISDNPSNHGLSIGVAIESTGSGEEAATISIDGTGGLNSSSIGAIVSGSINSIDGDVTIIGRGINNNDGARVSAAITATGTASLTIEGTSDDRTGTVLHSDAYLAAHDGPILVKGQGRTGVSIDGIRGIQSTGVSDGTTPSLATITIEGVASSVIGSGIAEGISSVDGNILITGSGSSRGVSLSNFGEIVSNGTGPFAASITIHGTSGNSGFNTYGVHLSGSTSSVTSTDGDINITGVSGDASLEINTSNSYGVLIEGAELVSEGDGIIDIDGTSGTARTARAGVQLTNATIRSRTTDVLVEGEQDYSSGYAFAGWGVGVSGGQVVSDGSANFTFQSNSKTLFGANASLVDGDLLINGLSDSEARTTGNIVLAGTGAISVLGGIATVGSIESEFGDITIEGQSITVSGDLRSTGTGPNAAKIQIGGAMARTIQVSGNLSSVEGDITIANQIDDPTIGTGYVRISGDIESTGTGKDTAATITINGSAAGREIGVRFMATDQTISSVAGDIHITGSGGHSTSGSFPVHGVELLRTNIRSTGTGDDSAKITINGTGGTGVGLGTGVVIDGDNASEIISVNGAIAITGVGGSIGTGINLRETSIKQRVIGPDDPEFDPDETGQQAASITIDGTGGGARDGVLIEAASIIETVNGHVRIDGEGGDGESNGVDIVRSEIVSTGEGLDAGTLTIDGTAGQGESGAGVYVFTSTFESQDGAISVTGRGGGIRTTGLEWIGSTVSSNGTGEHAATIDLIGVGADGTRSNHGIEIDGNTSTIISIDGDITIDGRAGSGGSSSGLLITGMDQITSTGDSADAARISIFGDGGVGSGKRGVVIVGASSSTDSQSITSGYGDIVIIGQGTVGQAITIGSHPWKIQSTGEGAAAANIRIEGVGSVGLGGANSEIVSIDGDIVLESTGGSLSVGIPVTSAGTGVAAGNIRISGTGGRGVSVNGQVTTTDGNVAIHGTDASYAFGTVHGISIGGGVNSIGTGADAGHITITGTSADLDGHGVLIWGSGVTSQVGNIEISGTGGGGSGAGVYLRQQVSSTGTDKATAATITIDGSAGTGSRDSAGVLIIAGAETLPNLTTVAGDVTIKGTGGTGGDGGDSAYFGVHLLNAYVASLGTDPANAGNISIEGIGGTNGTSNLVGVEINRSTSQLVSAAGDIEIEATAGMGTGPLNLGLRISDLSEIGGENTIGDITLRTDSIDLLSGSIQSSGTLKIEPKTDGTSVGIGGGVGELNLDANELARLVDGFAAITIGSDTTGELRIDTATFTDDVTLAAGGNHVQLVGTLSLSPDVDLEIHAQHLSTAAGSLVQAQGTGAIALYVDQLDIELTSSIQSHSVVTVAPLATSREIELGVVNANALSLSSAMLNRILTPSLVIGRDGIQGSDPHQGNITLAGDVTFAASTDLSLITAADIILAGAMDTAGGLLTLTPGVAPQAVVVGLSPTSVIASELSIAAGRDLRFTIDGTTAASEYSQLNLTGALDLTEINLVVEGAYPVQLANQFRLINKTGNDPLSGNFVGLPEGSVINFFLGSPLSTLVSYQGRAEADENDLLLTIIERPRISGMVFEDADNNGVRQGRGIAGVVVHLDVDGDGVSDTFVVTQQDDPTTSVDETGRYEFWDIGAGQFGVRTQVPQDWQQTLPGNEEGYTFTLAAGQSKVDQDFGLFSSDVRPPVVDAVYATSSAWSNLFISSLGTNGIGQPLAVGDGPLPWSNVDRLVVQFSEGLFDVNETSVELRDSSGLVAANIVYDPVTYRAIVELPQPLGLSKYRLAISDTLVDLAGNIFDGDGSGVAGGLFNFRFDVAPGDGNRDGRVNGSDLAVFAGSFNQIAGAAGFDPFANWNGDSRVNGADLAVFSSNFNQQISGLPEPGAPFGGGGGAGRGAGKGSGAGSRWGSSFVAPPIHSGKQADRDAFFANFFEDDEEKPAWIPN